MFVAARYVRYLRNKRRETMEEPVITQAGARLVMAGAHAVALATEILAFIGDIQRLHPEAAPLIEKSAMAVLKDWGLSVDPAPAPAPERAPAPTPEEPILLWPPQRPQLPGVYRDHYYHVRQDCIGRGDEPGDSALVLKPEDTLQWVGRVIWSSEDDCYLMRMHASTAAFAAPGVPIVGTTWVRSKDIRVGAEIPLGERL
jgi:hypothetical protein